MQQNVNKTAIKRQMDAVDTVESSLCVSSEHPEGLPSVNLWPSDSLRKAMGLEACCVLDSWG